MNDPRLKLEMQDGHRHQLAWNGLPKSLGGIFFVRGARHELS